MILQKLSSLLVIPATLALMAATLDAQCCGEKTATPNTQCCGSKTAKANAGGTINTSGLVALFHAKVPFTLIDARKAPKQAIPGARALNAACQSCDKTLAGEFQPVKKGLIVTYCAGPKCTASAKLASRLRQAGFTNVLEYPEGYAGWAGYAGAFPGKCNGSGSLCASAAKSSCSSCSPKEACSSCVIAAKKARAKLPAPTINTAGLKTLMDAKVPVLVLDARTGEWDDGNRLPGATALKCPDCLAKPAVLQKLAGSKNRLVVTYCAGPKCPASSQLAAKLRQGGYGNVIEYREGIQGWRKAGFRTSKQAASSCGTCGDGASSGKAGTCASGTCGGGTCSSGTCGGK